MINIKPFNFTKQKLFPEFSNDLLYQKTSTPTCFLVKYLGTSY